MATYVFTCVDCVNERLEIAHDYYKWDGAIPVYDDVREAQAEEAMIEADQFDVEIPMKEISSESRPQCPACSGVNTRRILTPFAIHYGLSAAEKTAGTPKKRVEMAKHLKAERDIRKKNAQPGTQAAISNEIWSGGALPKGVISDSVKRVK